MLADLLSRLAVEYSSQRIKPFANSDFGNFVRHDIALAAKKHLVFKPFDFTVKASVGAGLWAAVPWVAFFDPLITESATKGFYVVYLINAQDNSIILSLNQGTTEIYNEFGQGRGREVLERRAIDMRERIPEFAKLFDCNAISLGSTEKLPLGYEAGHAFGRTYKAYEIDNDTFSKDLDQMLYAYQELVSRGGTTPTETMIEASGTADIFETRKYFLSSRIERAPKVRSAVLAARNPICECCGMDPAKDYNYSGPLKNTPLDVHHSIPLHSMKEGESRRYKIPDDFLILCPNCHRMIHKQQNPSDLDQLKNSIRFKYARLVGP